MYIFLEFWKSTNLCWYRFFLSWWFPSSLLSLFAARLCAAFSIAHLLLHLRAHKAKFLDGQAKNSTDLNYSVPSHAVKYKSNIYNVINYIIKLHWMELQISCRFLSQTYILWIPWSNGMFGKLNSDFLIIRPFFVPQVGCLFGRKSKMQHIYRLKSVCLLLFVLE